MLLSTMPDDLRAKKGYYAVGGCGGNIAWHTENDTLEIADKDILLTDIKIYLLSVLRTANAEVLPFDWRAVTKEFAGTLENYQQAAGEGFSFEPAQGAVKELNDVLTKMHEGLEHGTVTPSAANAVIRDLARLLVPINFTQDPRFFHDPALTQPPLPDLAPARDLKSYRGDMLGFAQTELIRGQNRVVSTLRAATRRVKEVLV